MKAEIKLGPKEVEEIIRDYIVRETNHAVQDIRFSISSGDDTPYMRSGPSLREVVVSVELDGNKKLHGTPPPPPPPPPPRTIKSGLV